MEIHTGNSIEEVKNFQLFNEDNDGDEITVIAVDGQVVAYAQHTDGDIYFMESEQRGAGRALVDWFKGEYSHLVAHTVEETAKGFWTKMGFSFAYGDGFGGETWTWEG